MFFLRFLALLAAIGFGKYTVDSYGYGHYPEAAIGFVITVACALFVGNGIVDWLVSHTD